jgi:hypothetical protein
MNQATDRFYNPTSTHMIGRGSPAMVIRGQMIDGGQLSEFGRAGARFAQSPPRRLATPGLSFRAEGDGCAWSAVFGSALGKGGANDLKNSTVSNSKATHDLTRWNVSLADSRQISRPGSRFPLTLPQQCQVNGCSRALGFSPPPDDRTGSAFSQDSQQE